MKITTTKNLRRRNLGRARLPSSVQSVEHSIGLLQAR